MSTTNLTIATWNILATAYIRPQFYPNVDPAHLDPLGRIPAVAKRARELNADILCLQEVERASFDAIQKELLNYSGFLEMKPQDRPDGCATFLRGFSFLAAKRVVLEQGHIAQVLTLSPDLVIANTHLKWNPPSRHFAERQARQLLESLPAARIQIVCGDFNAEPGSGPLRIFEDAGFTHPHQNTPTFNSSQKAKQIDFILHRGDVQVTPQEVPAIDDHTPLPSALHPSDHLPLSATLTIINS